MKQILVLGATGSYNVGDDILGLILQRMLQKTIPGAKVLVRPQHVRDEIETSDLIVIGGGGLIYDATFENVTNYTSIILRAQDQAIPVYMAGMGVQYMMTEEAKEIYRDALRFVKAISVRNDVDGDYLINELGCKPSQIIYSRDLAFLAPEVIDIPPMRQRRDKPRLIVSLADLLIDLKLDSKSTDKISDGFAKHKQNYMTYVHENIGRLLAYYDVQLVVQAQEDVPLYTALRENHPELELIEFAGIEDSWRLIQVFQEADIAITGRYHGLIAGVVAGTPTIGVSFGGHKIGKLIDDSFPSLRQQFYTMQQLVDEDIFSKLVDKGFTKTLRTPTSGELRRCMKKARQNWRLMKMIAGECAKM